MKPYVDIEGSGELTTKITFSGSADLDFNSGTVIGANEAELRFLTVVNTGGNTYAGAISNDSASPRLTHVTAIASGSQYNGGVYTFNASPRLTHVTINVSGGEVAAGVLNRDNTFLTMTDSTVNASASSLAAGVFNFSASATLQNCAIQATGETYSYSIYNQDYVGGHTLRVNNSPITSSGNTIYNISGAILIGASQLNGGAVDGGGITCAGVYDEAYTFYADTCP